MCDGAQKDREREGRKELSCLGRCVSVLPNGVPNQVMTT